MTKLLEGGIVAQAINEKTADIIANLKSKGIEPALAIVRVGERDDDITYERNTIRRCEKLGIKVERNILKENSTQEELENKIISLNNNKSIHGILVFMPLPDHMNERALRELIDPQKDVDGITDRSLAGVFTGTDIGFPPCTAQACIEILDYYGIDCKGKRASVVGRSLVVGKPVSMLLLNKNATVTVCHTKTEALASQCKNSEIIIAAVGKPKILKAENFSQGQVIIDVGINFENGKLCGDVDFDAALPLASAITPVPGGVGTVTSALMVNHVAVAAARQNGLKF